MPRILGLVLLFIAWTDQAFAPFQVGNGGDYLRIVMEQARTRASTIARKATPLVLSRMNVGEDVKAWILANHVALASDILISPYHWLEQADPEQQTCALTHQPLPGEITPNGAEIALSFELCRSHIKNVLDATSVVIHESVHHFGIGDESFADKVAMTLVSVWELGLLNWVPVPRSSGSPAPRYYHSAEWDGKNIWIYGGVSGTEDNEVALSDLYRYNLESNMWQKWEVPGLPKRLRATILAIGNDRLLIWGGYSFVQASNVAWQNSGVIVDLVFKTAKTIRFMADPAVLTNNFVAEYQVQSAIWTGKEVLIFGGLVNGATLGYRFDPLLNKLSKLTKLGGDAPVVKSGHSAVWTGEEMIVWGGMAPSNDYLRSGAAYSLSTGVWRDLPTQNAPSASTEQSAIWTGDSMLTFGGRVYGPTSEGGNKDLKGTIGIYNIASDTWQSFPSDLAIHRLGHSVAWTGSQMLVWGGHTQYLNTNFDSVLGFDPHEKRWNGLSSGQITERRDHAGVWTGNHLFIWGGRGSRNSEAYGDGAIFMP
ncbi:MAG: kelch repeat-containing protein [Oligoflexales bacterium]